MRCLPLLLLWLPLLLLLISRCDAWHLDDEQSECSDLSSLSSPPPGFHLTRDLYISPKFFHWVSKSFNTCSFCKNLSSKKVFWVSTSFSRYHLVSDWSSEASESRHSSIIFFLRFFQVLNFSAKKSFNTSFSLFPWQPHVGNVQCHLQPLCLFLAQQGEIEQKSWINFLAKPPLTDPQLIPLASAFSGFSAKLLLLGEPIQQPS